MILSTSEEPPSLSGRKSVQHVWHMMKQRCSNPSNDSFRLYGGRGITVCERWQVFANFVADMGPRPSPRHSLDRIDNDRGYSPENCRWATAHEQQRNKSTTHAITAFGKTQCVTDWGIETGLGHAVISNRIRRGWAPEDALTTPQRRPGDPVKRRGPVSSHVASNGAILCGAAARLSSSLELASASAEDEIAALTATNRCRKCLAVRLRQLLKPGSL